MPCVIEGTRGGGGGMRRGGEGGASKMIEKDFREGHFSLPAPVLSTRQDLRSLY